MYEAMFAFFLVYTVFNMFAGMTIGGMINRSGLGAALGALYGPLGIIMLLLLPRD